MTDSNETVNVNGFWLQVGDRVSLNKEPILKGTVVSIDENLIPGYGVTTCQVLWDGDDGLDTQWTNKLSHTDD